MTILGFSCFERDSAACLVRGGRVVAAVQEERLSCVKNDPRFPLAAIRHVLDQAGINGASLDTVTFYENAALRAEMTPPAARAAYKAKIDELPRLLDEACGYRGKISYVGRHLSYAAASYFLSPFDEAVLLVADYAAEGAGASLFHAQGKHITPVWQSEEDAPALLCERVTAHLGFDPQDGVYKVMGLAAFGEPSFLEAMRAGDFSALGEPREDDAPLEQRHKDIAASLQKYVEEKMVFLALTAREKTGCARLCLSGETAQNIVANARLRKEKIVDEIFIPFATSTAAGALGAALYECVARCSGFSRERAATPYLGPSFSEAQIEVALRAAGRDFEKLERPKLLDKTATLLAADKIVGWFQGEMEFGPRALGHRSILASAANPKMKDILNLRVKNRETFRPFAPVVLAEKAQNYFPGLGESPWMLFGAQAAPEKREDIAAAVHADGSARPQTLRREDEPLFYDLIARYAEISGVPVLINTSFNVRGEPIVCTPQDALRRFAEAEMDALALGSFLIRKKGA